MEEINRMKQFATRREFVRGLALSAAAATLPSTVLAMKKRHINIGHTGITWRNNDMEHAITDVSDLGFYGFETFGNVFDTWEQKPGGLGAVLQAHNLPLISAYCNVNLTDPSRHQQNLDDVIRWSGIVKKYGGRFIVIGPNPVHRDTYDFAGSKGNIVSALNEICQVIADHGLTAGLHQHTGTCVMTRDETYAVLDAVNTKYVRFAPDIGQLTKGGADAVQVVKDYLPIVEHMHLKDFNDKDRNMVGYCPLGEGKVDVLGILDIMQKKEKKTTLKGMVMVELDYNNREDITPLSLATTSRNYLLKNGVTFRKV
jgi:inosose dehydratase